MAEKSPVETIESAIKRLEEHESTSAYGAPVAACCLRRTIAPQLEMLWAARALAPVTDKSRTEAAFARIANSLAEAILEGAN